MRVLNIREFLFVCSLLSGVAARRIFLMATPLNIYLALACARRMRRRPRVVNMAVRVGGSKITLGAS